jgi:putative FmdB family regulatory protein
VPIYTYVCKDCGKELEVRQDFHDAPLAVCPHCSGRLRKSFNAVGVVFKGSGFYRNDSREQVSKPADKAASGSSDAGGDGSPAKSGEAKGAPDRTSSDRGPTDGRPADRGTSGRTGPDGAGSSRSDGGTSAGGGSSTKTPTTT